jgi:hypothetical protein
MTWQNSVEQALIATTTFSEWPIDWCVETHWIENFVARQLTHCDTGENETSNFLLVYMRFHLNSFLHFFGDFRTDINYSTSKTDAVQLF